MDMETMVLERLTEEAASRGIAEHEKSEMRVERDVAIRERDQLARQAREANEKFNKLHGIAFKSVREIQATLGTMEASAVLTALKRDLEPLKNAVDDDIPF